MNAVRIRIRLATSEDIAAYPNRIPLKTPVRNPCVKTFKQATDDADISSTAILTELPVVPERVRQTISIDIEKEKKDELDVLYNKLRAQGTADNVKRIMDTICDRLKNKNGLIQNAVLKKRINRSGRAVIVPDPCISIDEICLPMFFAVHLLIQDGARQRSLRNGDIVFVNRQPTLHLGNLLSFRVILRKQNVISINPLCCKSFNADFDGDEMNIFAISNTLMTQAEMYNCMFNKPSLLQDLLISRYIYPTSNQSLTESYKTLTEQGFTITCQKQYFEAIINSGAKGKQQHLDRIFGQNGFMNGIADENFLHEAIVSRIALVESKMQTSKPGYLYKEMCYFLKDLVVEYDMTTRLNNIIIQFYNPSEPGTRVGTIAATGICEPATQLTLNTFHRAGMVTKEATTIERLSEVLECKKPQQPWTICDDTFEVTTTSKSYDVEQGVQVCLCISNKVVKVTLDVSFWINSSQSINAEMENLTITDNQIKIHKSLPFNTIKIYVKQLLRHQTSQQQLLSEKNTERDGTTIYYNNLLWRTNGKDINLAIIPYILDSNDIVGVYRCFGIEAAHNIIVRELQGMLFHIKC